MSSNSGVQNGIRHRSWSQGAHSIIRKVRVMITYILLGIVQTVMVPLTVSLSTKGCIQHFLERLLPCWRVAWENISRYFLWDTLSLPCLTTVSKLLLQCIAFSPQSHLDLDTLDLLFLLELILALDQNLVPLHPTPHRCLLFSLIP